MVFKSHYFLCREYEKENDGLDPATPSSSDKLIDGRLRVPGSVWTRLYGYQRTGVHWLWELHCQQAGGVVGDEMGLGKTIQMIAFFAALRVSRLRSHVTKYECHMTPLHYMYDVSLSPTERWVWAQC